VIIHRLNAFQGQDSLVRDTLSEGLNNISFGDRADQGCWRNDGSMDRGVDRGQGLGLAEPFFLIPARSSNSTRYFEFCKNTNSISKNRTRTLDRFQGIYTPRGVGGGDNLLLPGGGGG
jgi:hypothetical protein